MSLPALRFDAVVKEFSLGEARVRALDGLTLELAAGTFTAIVGRSGSGKSTLLNLAAGLDRPTSGEVFLAGQPLSRLGDDEITRLRRERVGVVYQFFHLLPTLEVRENVALPLLIAGVPGAETGKRVRSMLEKVGLAAREKSRPSALSTGEQQRVGIARALVAQPLLLLADEPTGNLDPTLAGEIMQLFAAMQAQGTAVLVASHDLGLVRRMRKRVLVLDHGRLSDDISPEDLAA